MSAEEFDKSLTGDLTAVLLKAEREKLRAKLLKAKDNNQLLALKKENEDIFIIEFDSDLTYSILRPLLFYSSFSILPTSPA